ncbi:MAG: DUF2974 domain-containing protein [Oscillospiraceae bacterium]
MSNIIDYVSTQFATFQEKPFNTVDSLVLSQLSYIFFDNITKDKKQISIGELLKAEHFKKMFERVLNPDETKKLLFSAVASPRFRDIKLCYYVNETDIKKEKQFSAVTYLLDKKTSYIAFRGTDQTFVGWKEDFNMAFISPVPSQIDALNYLNFIAKKIRGSFYIGGHSKGGNLAVYSSLMSSSKIKDRIIRIYSHDGPGFKENIFSCDEYKQIEHKIEKTLPQSSIIGMLLQNQENYTIVKSKNNGIMQHDPFSWIVEKGHFIYQSKIDAYTTNKNNALNQWINSLTDEKRERFVECLYHIIKAGNIEYISDMPKKWNSNIEAMLNAAKNLDEETKKFVYETIKQLVVMYIKSFHL